MEQRKPLKLGVQFFAEGDGPEGGPPAEGEAAQGAALDYEALLATDTNLQAFLESQIAAARETAMQEAARKLEAQKSEAEKLAQMNEQEKAAYELEQLRQKVERYEAAENARKVRDLAIEMAGESGVPTAWVDLIPFESVKAEEVQVRMQQFKKAYDEGVARGVAEKLNGAGTPGGAGAQTQQVSRGALEAMAINERLNMSKGE